MTPLQMGDPTDTNIRKVLQGLLFQNKIAHFDPEWLHQAGGRLLWWRAQEGPPKNLLFVFILPRKWNQYVSSCTFFYLKNFFPRFINQFTLGIRELWKNIPFSHSPKKWAIWFGDLYRELDFTIFVRLYFVKYNSSLNATKCAEEKSCTSKWNRTISILSRSDSLGTFCCTFIFYVTLLPKILALIWNIALNEDSLYHKTKAAAGASENSNKVQYNFILAVGTTI